MNWSAPCVTPNIPGTKPCKEQIRIFRPPTYFIICFTSVLLHLSENWVLRSILNWPDSNPGSLQFYKFSLGRRRRRCTIDCWALCSFRIAGTASSLPPRWDWSPITWARRPPMPPTCEGTAPADTGCRLPESNFLWSYSWN